MQKTQERHQAILSLIGSKSIYSQEELQTLLREQGVETTQATLSRDLKVLRIAKIQGEGYVLPGASIRKSKMADLAAGIKGVKFSGNIALARTEPGFANAVAIIIDGAAPSGILGTIAGDDTVLIILAEGVSRQEALATLQSLFPAMQQ